MEDAIARDYVARGARYLRHAKEAFSNAELADAVRFAQEATELSLKAALRWVGIDYPRAHDVGEVLVEHARRFPSWFRDPLREIAPLSHDLALRRGIALYGLEIEGRPASELFTDPAEVKRFLELAVRVQSLVHRLVGEERRPRR